jgi:nitrite reductase/ring-hydroxylating ferredoxin subunit
MQVPLCKLEEIPDEGIKTVEFFGRELLVFKANGKPKGILNICMHLGGPMQRQGDRLVCQWHGAEFDCQRGKALVGPAPPDSQLITLPTRIEDGVLSHVYGE